MNHNKTLEVCNYIKQNNHYLVDQNQSIKKILKKKYSTEIIELTTENIENYNLNLYEEFSEITTTHRTKEFLKWRFLKNPLIKYSLYGIVDSNLLVAYVALREETLNPFTYKVNRIIDLFGKTSAIKALLYKTITESISKNHIYVDFSMFGLIYEMELNSFKFIKLENENYSIIPQVTSPIENRHNGEFIGVFSKSFCKEINNLSKKNVYFTRMDSDRDRVANINQIR